MSKATVSVEDRFLGRFVDHVTRLSVFFPRPVDLHAHDADTVFHRGHLRQWFFRAIAVVRCVLGFSELLGLSFLGFGGSG